MLIRNNKSVFVEDSVNALASIARKLLPYLKKALPFIGVGGAAGIGGFFFGKKLEYRRCEKKYAKVCAALKELQETVERLETQRAPRREINGKHDHGTKEKY